MGELTKKSFEASEKNVKMLGRTYEKDGVLWLAHSASGMEFTVTGTHCSIEIVGDSMICSEISRARLAVFVDGERIADRMVDEVRQSVEVFEYDRARTVTVRLLKLSEAAHSVVGIARINVTSVGDICPTAEKPLKIEFIGDSITCGYGVDDEDYSHEFSTATEDAARAYAYRTAQLLDADCSLVSYSGYGIISGYTTQGVIDSSRCVPAFYENFAYSCGSTDGFDVSDIGWDFRRFVPDIIVINLGTNDESYTGNDEKLLRDYSNAYAGFLKTVRRNNPGARIICSLGIMGDLLYGAVCTAVGNYTAQTGDSNISAFRFTPQDGSTGYAANWHPTAATHAIAARELADHIKTAYPEH